MLNSLIRKHFLKTLIIAFVLLFTFVSFVDSESKIESLTPNPHLKVLPQKYSKKLQKILNNDSIYFCFTTEEFGSRELVILKSFPRKSEEKMDFSLQLYPAEQSFLLNGKKYIEKELKNDAVLYNYNGTTYGIWRIAIPYINMAKIIIEEKPFYKKEKIWQNTIDDPFSKELVFTSFNKLTPIKSDFLKLQPNPYSEVLESVLKRYEISAQDYKFSVVNDSLFQVNKNIDAYIADSNITLASLTDQNIFWNYINTKDPKLLDLVKVKGENANRVSVLLENYVNNNIKLYELFNTKKLASFFSIENLFSLSCQQSFHLIYDEKSNLLEPFYSTSKCLGNRSNYIKKLKIEDLDFVRSYIKTLKEIAELDIYKEFIVLDPNTEGYFSLYNHYYPQNSFDLDLLRINQRVIKKSLSQASIIKPELLEVTKNHMIITVLNMSNYPIEIKELNHNKSKIITALNDPIQILGGKNDTIKIALPRSFENLFVSKKKKIAEFKLYKHINDLFIGYNVLGLNKTSFSNIIPYQKKTLVDNDLFREKHALDTYNFIEINKEEKYITLSKDNVTIDFPLVIPRGFTFSLKAGTQIDIVNGGKIISHSPLKFLGTKANGIKVFSSDKQGQGILVLAEGEESEIKFTTFLDLTNPKHGHWSVTGAVTFYESPVKMTNVLIEGNKCEDALNIVRTTFYMSNCEISKTQSDAFDGDFVKGSIVSSRFLDLGNDAIDISGSDLNIKHVDIINAGDKGLSAGEDSKMTLENIKITDSEIAVASKDFSIVTINNLKIENTKLGFTAFQKKPEFGPSTISVKLLDMNNVETKYLVERSSVLTVNGEKIETSANVKDRMYGVEFGKSSAETRNSQ